MSLLRLDNYLKTARETDRSAFAQIYPEAVLVIEVEESPDGTINFQPRIHRPGKEAVLLVDRNEDNLNQLADVFAGEFEVMRARDGNSALAAALSYQPAAVITAQSIPEKSGVALLTDLEQRVPTAMRVLVTSEADYDLLVEAINMAKIHHYVEKHTPPTQVKAAVDSLLRAQSRFRGEQAQRPRLQDYRIARLVKLKEYLWVDKQVCLGRQKENDLVLQDPSVSKRHVHFSVSEDRIWLSDLGSKNGTKLNAEVMAPHRPTRLFCGDELRIGRVWMTFRTPSGFYEFLQVLAADLAGQSKSGR